MLTYVSKDNVTNDLIYALVNDHGFEDTAISRIYFFIFLTLYDIINIKSIKFYIL